MRTGILNCFLVICVFLSITSGLFAQPQEKTITGKVVLNDLSEPAVGAVVQEKGTNNASATSTGGQFSLKVSNTPATLVVSYMGYKTQEVVVKGGSVEVVLEEDSQSLDEVVVVAYGTMKKSDLTGSVASVSAEEINSMPVSSLDKALQGRVPGVSRLPGLERRGPDYHEKGPEGAYEGRVFELFQLPVCSEGSQSAEWQ